MQSIPTSVANGSQGALKVPFPPWGIHQRGFFGHFFWGGVMTQNLVVRLLVLCIPPTAAPIVILHAT